MRAIWGGAKLKSKRNFLIYLESYITSAEWPRAPSENFCGICPKCPNSSYQSHRGSDQKLYGIINDSEVDGSPQCIRCDIRSV